MTELSEQSTNLFSNFNWKIGVALIIPAFLIYPKPFLYALGPLIRHMRRSYHRTKPDLTKIVFSIDRQKTAQRLIAQNVINLPINNIFVIDLFGEEIQKRLGSKRKRSLDEAGYFGSEESQNRDRELISELWAQNIVHEIRLLNLQAKQIKNNNIAIMIKGRSQILRRIEAKLYRLKISDYYKIPEFVDEHELHVLQRNKIQSFEHTIYSPRGK